MIHGQQSMKAKPHYTMNDNWVLKINNFFLKGMLAHHGGVW